MLFQISVSSLLTTYGKWLKYVLPKFFNKMAIELSTQKLFYSDYSYLVLGFCSLVHFMQKWFLGKHGIMKAEWLNSLDSSDFQFLQRAWHSAVKKKCTLVVHAGRFWNNLAYQGWQKLHAMEENWLKLIQNLNLLGTMAVCECILQFFPFSIK